MKFGEIFACLSLALLSACADQSKPVSESSQPLVAPENVQDTIAFSNPQNLILGFYTADESTLHVTRNSDNELVLNGFDYPIDHESLAFEDIPLILNEKNIATSKFEVVSNSNEETAKVTIEIDFESQRLSYFVFKNGGGSGSSHPIQRIAYSVGRADFVEKQNELYFQQVSAIRKNRRSVESNKCAELSAPDKFYAIQRAASQDLLAWSKFCIDRDIQAFNEFVKSYDSVHSRNYVREFYGALLREGVEKGFLDQEVLSIVLENAKDAKDTVSESIERMAASLHGRLSGSAGYCSRIKDQRNASTNIGCGSKKTIWISNAKAIDHAFGKLIDAGNVSERISTERLLECFLKSQDQALSKRLLSEIQTRINSGDAILTGEKWAIYSQVYIESYSHRAKTIENIQTLIELGFDVNQEGFDNKTVMERAAQSANIKLFKVLKSAGAGYNIPQLLEVARSKLAELRSDLASAKQDESKLELADRIHKQKDLIQAISKM